MFFDPRHRVRDSLYTVGEGDVFIKTPVFRRTLPMSTGRIERRNATNKKSEEKKNTLYEGERGMLRGVEEDYEIFWKNLEFFYRGDSGRGSFGRYATSRQRFTDRLFSSFCKGCVDEAPLMRPSDGSIRWFLRTLLRDCRYSN